MSVSDPPLGHERILLHFALIREATACRSRLTTVADQAISKSLCPSATGKLNRQSPLFNAYGLN